MMLPRQFASLVLVSFLAACAGSVETIGGDGDSGDGDSSYGDGDGDGDGDLIGPTPGDGDFIGPTPGDGDVSPGDGDFVVGGGTGVGGGRPVDPGTGGAGGGPIVPGVGGGIIVPQPGTGGGPGVIPIGPPIDPATCSPSYEYNDVYYCEQQVECAGTYAYVWCDSYNGGGQCYCDRSGASFSIAIDSTFFSDGAGCDRMMDACLGAGELDVLGPPVCEANYFEQNTNYCATNLVCNTPVDVGGAVGNIQQWSDTWCEDYSGQWVCNCYSGNTSSTITYLEDQTSPDVCLDTIAMCGSAVIDPDSPLSCEPRSQWAQPDYCNFELECSQERAIDGQRVEVSVWQTGSCQLGSGDQWNCSCGGSNSYFGVTGGSSWEACTLASTECGN